MSKSYYEQAKEQYNRLRRGEEGREERAEQDALNDTILLKLAKDLVANRQMIEELLAKGADPYYKEKGQNSAFDHAMSSGNLEIMHAMYQAKSNPDHKMILNKVTVARITELTKQSLTKSN